MNSFMNPYRKLYMEFLQFINWNNSEISFQLWLYNTSYILSQKVQVNKQIIFSKYLSKKTWKNIKKGKITKAWVQPKTISIEACDVNCIFLIIKNLKFEIWMKSACTNISLSIFRKMKFFTTKNRQWHENTMTLLSNNGWYYRWILIFGILLDYSYFELQRVVSS